MNAQNPSLREPSSLGDWRENWVAAFCWFLAACVFLSWPWISGAVTIPWDAKAHFYPQWLFLSHGLHDGTGVAWTPNVFAGWPQIADPQSLIFAPLYLVGAALAQNPGFALFDGLAFANLALGGIGMMLYFRDRGWGADGALVGALAFAFGGSAAWRLQHIGQVMSLAWFGLTLFALARALDRGAFSWGAASGAFAGFMVLGRDQVAWLFCWILTGFSAWRVLQNFKNRRNPRHSLLPLLGGMLAGLLVIAWPLAWSMDLVEQSNRTQIIFSEVTKGSLHPSAFLTLIAANLFGVVGPLEQFWGPPTPVWGADGVYLARNMGTLYLGLLPVLALFAVRWRGVDRDIVFWIFALVFAIVYALGFYSPLFAYLYHLPGADLWRRPADATFVIGALIAIIGGYAVQKLRSEPQNFSPLSLSIAMGSWIAACLWAAFDKGRFAQAKPEILWACAILCVAALAIVGLRRTGPSGALALCAVFVIFDLKTSNGPNESTAMAPRDFAMIDPHSHNSTIAFLKEKLHMQAPDQRDRIELAGLGFSWPNASLVWDFDHDLGYNPVRLELFTQFTHAEDHVALPEQREFSPAFPSYRSLAADLMGLRYIVTGAPAETIDKKLKPGDLKFLGRTADGYLYENERALPRVLFASKALVVRFAPILERGEWPEFEPRDTVLLEAASEPKARRPGAAKIVSYHNDAIEIALDAPDGGWLVLHDVYHPGWRAEIDGRPADILRANVIFRAVAAPPGAKRVKFFFAPVLGLERSGRDLWSFAANRLH